MKTPELEREGKVLTFRRKGENIEKKTQDPTYHSKSKKSKE